MGEEIGVAGSGEVSLLVGLGGEGKTYTRTEYGGTRAVLCWKNNAEDTCGTSRVISVPLAAFLPFISPLSLLFSRRASLEPIIRFTWGVLDVG